MIADRNIIAKAPYQMLYRDWLTLSTQVIWCYDHLVLTRKQTASSIIASDASYTKAWLIRTGSIDLEQKGVRLRAKAGQWLFLDKAPYASVIARNTHILSVAFESKWPDGTSLFASGFPLLVEAERYPHLEAKLKKVADTMGVPPEAYDIRDQSMDYRKMLRLQRDFSDWLLLLHDVLVDHNIAPSGHYSIDDRVMQAVRLLDAHPLDKPVNQKEIAHTVGMSQVQLTRLFATALRATPRSYFEKRRIEHARRHLILSDVQIKVVAFSLGFYDLAHFSKWFKKIHGTTPRDFVRTQRKKHA